MYQISAQGLWAQGLRAWAFLVQVWCLRVWGLMHTGVFSRFNVLSTLECLNMGLGLSGASCYEFTVKPLVVFFSSQPRPQSSTIQAMNPKYNIKSLESLNLNLDNPFRFQSCPKPQHPIYPAPYMLIHSPVLLRCCLALGPTRDSHRFIF